MNSSHSDQCFGSHSLEGGTILNQSTSTRSAAYDEAVPLRGLPHHQPSHAGNLQTPTLYMPIESPPTPAPSPGPDPTRPPTYPLSLASSHLHNTHEPGLRRQILASILASCTPSELLFISTTIAPLLKRDFLYWLPPELSLHILSYIDDTKSLVRVSQVSKHWRKLVTDECVWRRMSHVHGFEDSPREDLLFREHYKNSHITMTNWRNGGTLLQSHRIPVVSPDNGVVTSLALDRDWIVVGLANSKIHIFSAETGVLARTLVGHEMGVWAVCLVSKGGFMAAPPASRGVFRGGRADKPVPSQDDADNDPRNPLVKRYRRDEMESIRLGVDRIALASKQEQYISPSLRVALGLDPVDGENISPSDGTWDDHLPENEEVFPGKRSNNSYASEGWGQPNALVVSGGCDKLLRVWDIKTGYVFLYGSLGY